MGTIILLQIVSIPFLFIFIILEIFYVLIVGLCRRITNLND